MPYVAECPFCTGRVRVPNHTEGQSVACPRCGDHFTLVPMYDQPRDSGATPTRIGPVPLAPPVQPSARPNLVEAAAVPPRPRQPGIVAEPTVAAHARLPVAISAAPPEALPGRKSVLAALAFLAGSVGLLCASLPTLGALTLPLGGLGLVLGASTLIAATVRGRGQALPALGTTVSVLPLLAALWLAPPATSGRDRDAPHPAALGTLDPIHPAAAEWLNVRDGPLRQGDVYLRVFSARVGPVELKGAGRLRHNPGKRPALHIGLRLINVGVERQLDYVSWGEPERDGEGTAVLRDNHGKTYPLRAFGPVEEVVGHVRGGTVLPGKLLEDVLVFEPPPADVAFVRLDLPATAVGGTGRFRLEIPADMIRR